jgi:hypothetical protein
MKSNRIIWGIVALVVLVTIAVSFGTISSYSQKETPKEQDKNPFGDLSKYPIAEYDAPEPANAAEREERQIKNKRYDKKLLVMKNPGPEDIASIVSDAEPVPPAIPFAESSLIIIGKIQNSKASLSNDKSGVYSEYSVRIQTILKDDKLRTGETITFDRTGGVVQYPNGQKMLYLNDWQSLPEVNGRYVIFLTKDDDQNPNYCILTAYQLKDGKVTALDNHPDFREFSGMSETDFIKLVLSKK